MIAIKNETTVIVIWKHSYEMIIAVGNELGYMRSNSGWACLQSANNQGKGMNPIILSPLIDK